MRIAHIITRMVIGGAQENTLFNCQDLVRDYGDDVLLVTGLAVGPEGDLMQQGRGGEAVPTRIVPSLQRAIHPWRDRQALGELQSILRDFRPDVVHTHSAKGGFLGRLAAWSQRVPAIVHTVHGAPFGPYDPWPRRKFYQACERYAGLRCHHFISVADAMTDLMVAARVAPREKFTTIYSGMDVEPFLRAGQHREQARRELGYSDEHIVVGKIARLFELKGHDDIILLAMYLDRVPNLRFLFVGDGMLREKLQNQIDQAGLTDRFQFTGLVPPNRIPELIGAMDILIHTSRREGLARALPQALIAGKPVISYDVDGAREVCLDGQTGFLVKSGYFKDLQAPLLRLADDPALRQQLGAEGRRRFTDQFRHQTMTRRIRKLYERLLGEDRTAPH